MGGLDTGTIAANTSYAVWIAKAPPTDTVTAFISTSFTPSGVTVPSGVVVRRIGSISTDAEAKVRAFSQVGVTADRQVFYQGAISTLARLVGGTATSFTELELAPLLSDQGRPVRLYVVPSGTMGNSTTLRSSSTSTALTLYAPGTLEFLPGLGSTRMDYKNDKTGGTTDVYVLGYDDAL